MIEHATIPAPVVSANCHIDQVLAGDARNTALRPEIGCSLGTARVWFNADRSRRRDRHRDGFGAHR
jgi:hypothetical protein